MITRVRQEIIDRAILHVRRDDRIAVAAFSQRAGQNLIKKLAVGGAFLLVKDADAFDIACTIITLHLGFGQRLRVEDRAGVKLEPALQLAQLRLVGDDLLRGIKESFLHRRPLG